MSVQSLTMRVWKTKTDKGARSLLTDRGFGVFYVNIGECTQEELLALAEAICEATGLGAKEEKKKEE